MAVGGEPASADLAPVVVQLLLGDAPFQECARVDARGGVRLEVDEVAGLPGAEEVIEAHLEEIRRRGIARDVPAQLGVRPVGANHHRERVPANDRREALLHFQAARELWLIGERDRVAVGRVEHRWHAHALRPRAVEQLAQDEGGTLGALRGDQRVERVDPLAGLGGVDVRRDHAPVAGEGGVCEIGQRGTSGFADKAVSALFLIRRRVCPALEVVNRATPRRIVLPPTGLRQSNPDCSASARYLRCSMCWLALAGTWVMSRGRDERSVRGGAARRSA